MSIRDEAVEMYSAGMSEEAIADELGRAVSTVRGYLRAAGIKKGKPGPSSPLDMLDDIAKDLLIEKYTTTDIPAAVLLREFGIGYMALYRLLKEKGIEPRNVSDAVQQAYQDRLDHAVKLYEQGVKVIAIRAETGISSRRMYEELAKREVPLRKG
jgi:transposase